MFSEIMLKTFWIPVGAVIITAMIISAILLLVFDKNKDNDRGL